MVLMAFAGYGYDDSPMAKLTFRVTDSLGTPVTNAEVGVSFYLWSEKPSGAVGKTDTNGLFTVEGLCSVDANCSFVKDGYYLTKYRHTFPNPRFEPNAVKAGKWQPWNPTTAIMLKEKRNPIPMCVKSAGFRLPKKGETFGFDFKAEDLVEPHGKGTQADILLKCWGDKPIPLTHAVSRFLTLSWDNGNEGVIRKVRDLQSMFHSLHEAPDNGYNQKINLCYRRTNDKVLENNEFPENEYLIFRSRVELDDEGKIVKAHYGKIFDIWFDISANNLEGAAVRFLYYFNPNENDRNLEYDGKNNLLNPRDPHYAPSDDSAKNQKLATKNFSLAS